MNIQTERKKTKKNPGMVFLANGIGSQMFKIQSMPVLNELKKNFEIKIISIEDDWKHTIEDENNNKLISSLKKEFDLDIITFFKLPFLPKIINQIIQVSPKLYIKTKKIRAVYFHARGYLPAIILHYIKYLVSVKYIFDMRGMFVDELKILYNLSENNIKIRLWRHLERRALLSSDQVVVVSTAFADYVRSINPDSKINIIKNSVIKNAINRNEYLKIRQKIREQLGVSRKTVWIYSGSTYKWQLIPTMVNFFSKARNMAPDLFFLVICNDNPSAVRQLFADYKIPDTDYKIISVPPNEVQQYLFAGDIGILLREQNIVNRVSHPLKFVEYLYAGLKVIISGRIGDTQYTVVNQKLGVVLDILEEEEFIRKYKMLETQMASRDPVAIIEFARSEFNFATSCGQYETIYQKLMATDEN